MAELKYIDGLREALHEEMERDSSIIALGEDVAAGGAFGVTQGLVEAFGARRVINTPISEDTIMGFAVGCAIAGKRPIIEIMFMDFMTLAMSQLVNHAAKLHYMSGGQLSVPMVIRVQQGAVGAWGAHHSQSLEAWFAHVPGLKLVAPATPGDAKGLLKASIRDNDPVIFIEHRGLYFKGEGVVDGAEVALGEARVAREGTDITIATYSKMLWEALDAAEALAGQGISAEVVDLRSIVPLDLDTIVDSVKKTNRLVIAHEAVMQGGVGAEIAAQIQRSAFDWLDAPIERVGAPFSPVPASPGLEQAFLPGKADIVAMVQTMLGANGK